MPRRLARLFIITSLLLTMLAGSLAQRGVPGAAAVGVGDYTVTAIPGLAPGGTYTNPKAINDAGVVVGDDAASSQAIRWTSAGGTVALAVPGGTRSSSALAINASGQSAGFIQFPVTFYTHAYRWNAGSGGSDLVPLTGGTTSYANDINDAGAVVGYANDVTGAYHAVLWAAGDTTPVDLGIPTGYSGSSAAGINAAGQIVGDAFDDAHNSQAFLWTAPGNATPLGFLPGGSYSSAVGINAAGVVVGVADNATGDLRIFRWTTSTGMIDLGVPPGGYSESFSVITLNDLGQIGAYGFNGTDQHAFVWLPDTGFSDLRDLDGATTGAINGQVYGLNNRGQIVGYADNPDRGLLLTPTDTTAPTTTATPSGTPGNAGWFRSDVTVNLAATDSGNPNAFGVARITYSATGPQPIPTTQVAGASAAPLITAEGMTTLTYYATDNAGNQETPAKTLTVRIDKTPPVLTTTVNPVTAQPGETVSITVATDEPLVGPPTVTVAGTCIITSTVPVSPGGTSQTYVGSYTLPADAGACTVTVTASGSDSAGNPSTGGTATFASRGAPPAVSLSTIGIDFGNQLVGTTGTPRQIVLTNIGGRPLNIASVALGGAQPGDFTIAYNSCAGSLVPQQSCVVAVSFAPTATGARAASLVLTDDAAGSPRAVALTGVGALGAFVVTASASGAGTVTPAGAVSYDAGSLATYIATASANQVFLGWTLDGRAVGYASPLTFTVNGDRTLVAHFAPRPVFTDVSPNDPDYEAITVLAAAGIINPQGVNGSGRFEPDRAVARAEVAALVARVFGWQQEFHRNNFPDRCDPANANCIDDELWNNVAALADYGVVGGYTDAATCQSAGTLAPCYLPRDNVSRLQVVSIVARAFTKTPDLRPTGTWDRLPAQAGQYTNVADSGTQRSDLATYRQNAGPIPGQANDGTFPDPNGAASRRFIIAVLWQAYNRVYGTDTVP